MALLALAPVAGQPLQRLAKLRVEGLASGQRVRLDGGAAQARWLSEAGGGVQAAEFLLDYAKPGPYRVTLDALDADGFWLATLAESPLELVFPEEALVAAEPAAPLQPETPAAPSTTEALAEPQPWLPYRYVKPIRYGVHTYASPGGGAVRRSVNPGIYLSVRAETAAAGDRWFRTAQGDWIAASAVTFFRTSELRGVVLDGTPVPPPPPPPPPPPTEVRHGIVTSATLNVRARPGVSADNPPVATLAAGAAVTIYEERTVAGAAWYRIGESRWVHGGYVRLVSAPEPPPPPPPAGARRGVVTATTLNVRARPGVAADNPAVAALRAGAEVTIYASQAVGSETWYRIGDGRWVISTWVRLLTPPRRFRLRRPQQRLRSSRSAGSWPTAATCAAGPASAPTTHRSGKCSTISRSPSWKNAV